jgi:hypothetical protein
MRTAPKGSIMPEWIYLAGFLVAYFILMKWVLPKLGVPT